MENKKQIGDRTYTFGMLMPEDAIRVEVAIAAVIGEPLFKAFMATGSGGEADQSAAGAAAIGLMMSRMNSDDLIKTVRTVFKVTGIAGEKMALDLNADFSGRNKEMWQVFLAALRFNFADFLPEALLNSVQGMLPKSS